MVRDANPFEAHGLAPDLLPNFVLSMLLFDLYALIFMLVPL